MLKIDLSDPPGPLGPLSDAQSHLWLPHPSLSTCARAIVSRDTRGVSLSDEQRYNHFPVSPLASITWHFSGSGMVLEAGCPARADSPRKRISDLAFCGPFVEPTISWNPGPVHAMVLLLLPDALATLTGIDPGAYLGRTVPADSVLDAEWMAMCRQVQEAADDGQRVALIEAFLQARWQRLRPDAASLSRGYNDWLAGMTLRAGTSGLGRSLRQVERRIKQWTGRPLRELRGLNRSENAFYDAVVAIRSGAVDWSEVANNTGYADQSHLCRQTRAVTGFPPEELRRRIFADETFWVYRLWGFTGQP